MKIDLPLTDADIEVEKAAHLAHALELLQDAIHPKTYRAVDGACCRCGRWIALPQGANPLERWTCNACDTPDRPERRPNTSL